MNIPNTHIALTSALLTTLIYAPISSAIVNKNSVRQSLDSGAPAVTVKFADLDLERGTGAGVLYDRLRNAARKVCGQRNLRDLNQSRHWQQCYDEALDGAVARVGNARVTALHKG